MPKFDKSKRVGLHKLSSALSILYTLTCAHNAPVFHKVTPAALSCAKAQEIQKNKWAMETEKENRVDILKANETEHLQLCKYALVSMSHEVIRAVNML